VGIGSNEGRCTACHIGYGWQDNTFDFSDTSKIDCLICHDTTGTYKKHPSGNGGGGQPALMVDGTLTIVPFTDLQEVAYNVGAPTRGNCLACHANAGGGDNVKHGDLSTDLVSPTADMDVHMGGQGFVCQDCHAEQDHGVSGWLFHSSDEGGAAPDCARCHTDSPHAVSVLSSLLNGHTDRVSCQACHLPAFSRTMATTTEWYWDEAGSDDVTPDTQFGRSTYDKKKGRFVWDMNVAPELLWYNGEWERAIVGANDTYDVAGTAADPVVLAAPTATMADADAKIYPFKMLIGRQPADIVNKRIIVPHLFGTKSGDNPYWAKYDWDLALQEGAAYTGVPYTSGDGGFVNTIMYLKVDHEIAPTSQALDCNDCHGVPGFFESLGYSEDPCPGCG
jgi:octaheme c-type cytochrome (tetrathionate reductase family)